MFVRALAFAVPLLGVEPEAACCDYRWDDQEL